MKSKPLKYHPDKMYRVNITYKKVGKNGLKLGAIKEVLGSEIENAIRNSEEPILYYWVNEINGRS